MDERLYWDDIPWRMSQRNPNDFTPDPALRPPHDFTMESLYAQQIIEDEERIAHLEESIRVYRELLQATLDKVQKQDALIRTLLARDERRRG